MSLINTYRFENFTDKFQVNEGTHKQFDIIHAIFNVTITKDNSLVLNVRAVETTSNIGINKKYLTTTNTAGEPMPPVDATVGKDYIITYNGNNYFLAKKYGYRHINDDNTGFYISGKDLYIQLAA